MWPGRLSPGCGVSDSADFCNIVREPRSKLSSPDWRLATHMFLPLGQIDVTEMSFPPATAVNDSVAVLNMLRFHPPTHMSLLSPGVMAHTLLSGSSESGSGNVRNSPVDGL